MVRLLLLLLLAVLQTSCLTSESAVSDGAAVAASLSFDGAESAQAISHSKIVISFNNAKGGTGSYTYKVFANYDFSSPVLVRGGLTPDSSNKILLTITGLSISTEYDFIVRVSDGVSEELNNVVVTASTFSYPTPDFNGISLLQSEAGLNGTTRLRAFWPTAVAYTGTSIGSYNVYIRQKGGSFNFSSPYAVVPGGANETFITGLTSNTEYDVIVRASDNFGREEKNSNIKSAKTKTSLPISFFGVTSVSPASGIAGFNTLNIFWIPGIGDFDRYHVFVSNANIGLLAPNDVYWDTPYTTVFDTSASSLVLNGLSPKQTYYVAVRAVNGLTSDSETNTITRSAMTQPPLPQFLGAKVISQPSGASGLTQLKITWDAASGAYNRYRIFHKVAGTYDYTTPFATAASSATEITLSGLTTDTQYCFVVRAAYDVVAPVHTELNTVEVCRTPTYTPPTFDGLASCTVDTTPGMGPIRVNLNWVHATGIFDQYKIWQSTSPSINFNLAPTQTISSSLNTRLMSNLTPNTTYYYGVRAHYTNLTVDDGNTVVIPCVTANADLQFTQLTNGYKNAGNRLIESTQVCLRDNANASVPMATNVTMSLQSGSGTLGGTLTKSLSAGCATFDDLTYTGSDSIVFLATIAGVSTISSDPVSIITPGGPPPGACTLETANFITAYGGCYHVGSGLVMSSLSPTVLVWDNAVWEDDANGSTAEPHDNSDADGDGRKDDMGSDSSFFPTTVSSNGYCHDLIEGGYADWRLVTYTELTNLISNGLNLSTTGICTTCKTSTAVSATSARAENGSTEVMVTTRLARCVRNAETGFTSPTAPTGLTATTLGANLGASEVNLAWSAGSGTITGYAIWWATQSDGIDFNAAPNKVINGSLTAYRVQGLLPGTNYEFAVRSSFTRSLPTIEDNNTNKAYAVTKPARIEIKVFTGSRLNNDKLPLYAEIVENDTGIKVGSLNLPIEVEQLSGGIPVLGTLTIMSNNGVAKFTDLVYSDFSGTGQISLRVKSDYAASADTAVTTVPIKASGTCHEFDTNVYPASGGCYFKTLSLVTSYKSATTYSTANSVWESGVAPGYATKEVSDTVDNNGDGRFDDADPSSDYFLGIPNTYCHNLVEGGQTDWRVMKRADALSLFAANFKNYSFILTDASNVKSTIAYRLSTDICHVYDFTTGNLSSSALSCTSAWIERVICVRSQP